MGKTSIVKPSQEKLAAGRLAFLSVLAAFLLLFGSAAAMAQEIVTLSTRPGVTQSFFIANLGENPQAIAILFPGSGGLIRLRQENDQIKFGQNNFLVRSRGEFVKRGVAVAILDAPSDYQTGWGMGDEFRLGEDHFRYFRCRRRHK